MRPVEHTSTSAGATPRPARGQLAHARRVAPARFAGRGVGVAGVEHDRGRAAVGEMRACEICTGAACARFDVNTPAAADRRVVVGRDDREIGRAGFLDPAREPARYEPLRGGDAHG